MKPLISALLEGMVLRREVPELREWSARDGDRWRYFDRKTHLHWEIFPVAGAPEACKYCLAVRVSHNRPRGWVGSDGLFHSQAGVQGYLFTSPFRAVEVARTLNRQAPVVR